MLHSNDLFRVSSGDGSKPLSEFPAHSVAEVGPVSQDTFPTRQLNISRHQAHQCELDQAISHKLTVLHEARYALAKLLLAHAPLTSRELRDEIEQAPFIFARDIFKIDSVMERKTLSHLEVPETFSDLRHRIDTIQNKIFDIIDERNSDPDKTRSACHNRAAQVADAKSFLATLDHVHLLFTVEGIGLRVGGIVGRAMLLIEALLNELPNARVHVHSYEKSFSAAGAAFGSPAEGRLTMGQFHPEVPGRSECSWADLVVAVAGTRPSINLSTLPAHIKLHPFAYVQELGSLRWLGAPDTPELSPVLHQSPVCNDLHNPRGTVILDRGQYRARQERDSWDLARLAQERQAWRSAVIPEPCNRALEEAASREGWSVDQAIWGMCYVWDTDALAEELQALASLVRDNSRALPHDESSPLPHIVIHARVTAWGDFNGMAIKLANAGIRTISAETPHQPTATPNGPPLITIVLHSTIDNRYMRQAFAQLVGCPVRDSTGNHWIDFPVYVTGSASWLESLSAGGIVRHDDLDAVSGSKRSQIASLLLKQRILAGSDLGGASWTALHSRTLGAAEEYLIGKDPGAAWYQNLERLSARARSFTDALYQFNSVDDVIIALANRVRSQRVD
jgi:hypothetical protein